jgi:Fringe-like
MKVAICIFGCITSPNYCLQVLKIQETWGRRAEEEHGILVYYFLGEERIPGLDHPELWRTSTRLVYLPGVGNDYQSASFKQNLGIKYILDHHPDIDFVFVCGTDTFLNPDALLRLLTFMNSDEKLYIGGHFNHCPIPNDFGKDIYFHLGGAGFVLSRGILKELYPLLDTMTDEWIKYCHEIGKSEYSGACDVCISYHVQSLNAKIVKYYNRFYECNHWGIVDISKMYGYSRYYPCCQKHIQQSNIISAHNMSLVDFDSFYDILYKENWFR